MLRCVTSLPWLWRPLGLHSAIKTLPPHSVLPGMPYGEVFPLSVHTQTKESNQ